MAVFGNLRSGVGLIWGGDGGEDSCMDKICGIMSINSLTCGGKEFRSVPLSPVELTTVGVD